MGMTVKEKVRKIEVKSNHKSSDSRSPLKVRPQLEVSKTLVKSGQLSTVRNSLTQHRDIKMSERNVKILKKRDKIEMSDKKLKIVQKEEGQSREVQSWDHHFSNSWPVMKNSEPNQNGKGPGIKKEKGWDLDTEVETKPNKEWQNKNWKILKGGQFGGAKKGRF